MPNKHSEVIPNGARSNTEPIDFIILPIGTLGVESNSPIGAKLTILKHSKFTFMNKVQNFDGTMVINIGQQDGENVRYFKIVVENVNRLTLNQLAGTITKEVFNLYNESKSTGVKLFKANKPLVLHITDNSKHVLADSAFIRKEFGAKLNLLSKDRFGRIMFNGLKAMRSITKLSNLEDVISEKAMTFIGQDGVIFEALDGQLVMDVDNQSAE